MNNLFEVKNEIIPRVVVRLRTSTWSDRRGLHIRRDINFLARKSKGFNWFEEDISCAGPVETAQLITNLGDCPDGVYELSICDEHRDWETNTVVEWNYKLTPYKE